jgi:hypothetical protein
VVNAIMIKNLPYQRRRRQRGLVGAALLGRFKRVAGLAGISRG